MLDKVIYRAGIYCRLSSDDGTIGDSSSIQTQKLMLDKYCKEQGFTIYDYYVDDGYSGLNFNRPSFQRLVTDIESGRINLVITKDLSRLGRDYIQTGYYTEVYFQSKGVRYIALNDNIDTSKDNNDIAPFKNILNDMYARDLSRKVKTAKRQRALNGMFISAQTPFGYRKDPLNSNHLVIDEEAAKTVRLIFDLFLNGKGIVAIKKLLTEQKIITPAAYKAENGDTRFDRFYSLRGEGWEYNWCQATISKILKDMVYIGDMENKKYEIPNYKIKKRVKVPKESHIIVQNTHEAIILRDEYERVQELLTSRKRPHKHNYENVFKSLVFCMECGHRMHIYYKKRKRSTTILYLCPHHTARPDVCTHYNYIKYLDLQELITKEIRVLFETMKDNNKLFELLKQKLEEEDLSVKHKEDKAKIEKRLEALVNITLKIYSDHASGIIDDKTYLKMVNKCQVEQKELSEKLITINKQMEKSSDFDKKLEHLKVKVNQFLDFKELTKEMVYQLISKIIIEYPKKQESGKRTQQITIVWRFIEVPL